MYSQTPQMQLNH